MNFERLLSLASQGKLKRLSKTSFKADRSAGCERPVPLQWTCRAPEPDKLARVLGAFRTDFSGGDHVVYIDMYLPCRSCPRCLVGRGKLWTARAIAEINASARTWFGTLTFRPEEHSRTDWRLRADANKNGEVFEALNPDECARRRALLSGQSVTRFVKRVRHEAGSAQLRFLIVCELHKSGFPHYHMLLHECDTGAPVRKAALERQWIHGFSSWRLVHEAGPAARYVAKYLFKDSMTRCRASLFYGEPSQVPSPPQNVIENSIKEATNARVSSCHPVGGAFGSAESRGSDGEK